MDCGCRLSRKLIQHLNYCKLGIAEFDRSTCTGQEHTALSLSANPARVAARHVFDHLVLTTYPAVLFTCMYFLDFKWVRLVLRLCDMGVCHSGEVYSHINTSSLIMKMMMPSRPANAYGTDMGVLDFLTRTFFHK